MQRTGPQQLSKKSGNISLLVDLMLIFSKLRDERFFTSFFTDRRRRIQTSHIAQTGGQNSSRNQEAPRIGTGIEISVSALVRMFNEFHEHSTGAFSLEVVLRSACLNSTKAVRKFKNGNK